MRIKALPGTQPLSRFGPVLAHRKGYVTMTMSIEDGNEAEKLIEERGQIVAATWTHVAGLGSESGYRPCRRYVCGPEGLP